MAGNDLSRRETDYRVIRAQEDERKRLARDLHDGLVQSLVGIGVNLEVVERYIEADPAKRPEALDLLARLRETLAGCLEEARHILTDLRPLDLDGRSLSQALKDYAERVSSEAGVKVTVVFSGQETRLHPSLEAGLFRIFQEALNNIREHAAAGEVSLKLRFSPRSVAMDVADDGRGFNFDGDFNRMAEERCFGLVGINERVRLLGGTWRIASKPGHGTEIRVRLPAVSKGGLWSFLGHLGGRNDQDQERRDDHPGTGGEAGRVASSPLGKRDGGREGRAEAGGDPGRQKKVITSPAAASHPAQVLLADDHRVVREGMKMVFDLTSDFKVVGEADNGNDAIRLARELAPDVVLLDVVMPGPGAVETTRAIRMESPRTAVVILTAYHDPGQVRDLMAAGAAGYLLKTADSDEITGAVRAATSGLRPLAPEAVQALSGDQSEQAELPDGLSELTIREREILGLVGEGLTNREIGKRLYISEKTVRNHLGSIIRKLGQNDRSQVALIARELRPKARGEGDGRD